MFGESGDNPCLDNRAGSEAGLRRWYVIHTRSRQEKALGRSLTSRGVSYFLPLVEEVRYHGRRKTRVLTPLFSNYIFLNGTCEDAFEADRTGRIANIIRVKDQKKLSDELDGIRLAINTGAAIASRPALSKGSRVRVSTGPLKGVHGWVDDCYDNDRLILQVDMIGMEASLEIDGSLLEPAE